MAHDKTGSYPGEDALIILSTAKEEEPLEMKLFGEDIDTKVAPTVAHLKVVFTSHARSRIEKYDQRKARRLALDVHAGKMTWDDYKEAMKMRGIPEGKLYEALKSPKSKKEIQVRNGTVAEKITHQGVVIIAKPIKDGILVITCYMKGPTHWLEQWLNHDYYKATGHFPETIERKESRIDPTEDEDYEEMY